MSKLNQGESRNHNVWLKCFIKAMKESLKTGLCFYPRDDDVIMLQQIREMIQSQGNLERNMAQGQGKVTEEWIEKKMMETFARLLNINGPFNRPLRIRVFLKDFIRSLVKEAGVRV